MVMKLIIIKSTHTHTEHTYTYRTHRNTHTHIQTQTHAHTHFSQTSDNGAIPPAKIVACANLELHRKRRVRAPLISFIRNAREISGDHRYLRDIFRFVTAMPQVREKNVL